MITRRRVLALLPAFSLAAHRLLAQSSVGSRLFHRRQKPQAAPPLFTVFFGTDTARPAMRGGAPPQGIYSARFNSVTGQFSDPTLAAACVRPSFLALNRISFRGQQRLLLYSVNAGDAHTSGVTTYLVNPGPAPALTPLNQVSSAGEGPCYISVHATGRAAYVANYGGGTIASFAVQPDGSLSPPVERLDFHGKAFGHDGPVAARQEGPHPHSATLSPDSRFLVVNDLGHDDIVIFPVRADDPSRLGPPNLVESRTAGSGPRHIAFHPNGRWVYGVDEISNQVDQYLWNSTRGGPGMEPQAILTNEGRTLSTLAPEFHGPSTAAEIAVGPAGTSVYASNRGEDSLVVFSVDATNGKLALAQRISCGGKGPRHFTFDPSGRWLICANQDSASVTVFSRNDATGHLTGPVQTLPLEAPVFTLFT